MRLRGRREDKLVRGARRLRGELHRLTRDRSRSPRPRGT
jgi:hypothetical protein